MWNRVPGRWIILFLFLINLYTKINNKLILDGVKVRKGKIKRMSFEKILAVWSSEFGRSHTDSRIKLWTHRESQNFQHSLCLVSQGITARLKCYSETKWGKCWWAGEPFWYPSVSSHLCLGFGYIIKHSVQIPDDDSREGRKQEHKKKAKTQEIRQHLTANQRNLR